MSGDQRVKLIKSVPKKVACYNTACSNYVNGSHNLYCKDCVNKMDAFAAIFSEEDDEFFNLINNINLYIADDDVCKVQLQRLQELYNKLPNLIKSIEKKRKLKLFL